VKLFPLESFPKDRPAAIDSRGRVLGYGDLWEISLSLKQLVPSGSLALVLTRNTLGCVAFIVTLMNRGIVPILLDAGATAETISLYLVRYKPEVLVLPESLNKGFHGYGNILTIFDYILLSRQQVQDDRSVIHSELALLLSTSGSTGSPKLVRQSRINIISNAEAIASYLEIDANERPITSLPLHYTYGFSVLSSHIQAGATLLVTDDSVMDRSFWDFLNNGCATSMAGVPYTYQMLKRLGFMRNTPRTLRALTQAGGKLSDSLVREFAEYSARNNIAFYVMYGQTEATARISYVPAQRALEKAGSIGVAIPGGELFLLNESGVELVGPHVQGELGYRGPNVTMGYAEQRSDLGKSDERQGFLLTGDLAFRDEDNYYFIIGRRNRIAKLFGKRVSLEDLEQICLNLVPEVACTALEDKVTVWITDITQKTALPQFLAEHTGIHPSAYEVRVIDVIPRTSTGKIEYKSLATKGSA